MDRKKPRRVHLWSGRDVECHGGEINQSARRYFCARTGKYAELSGLSALVDAKAFGTFWSGDEADPVIGGGVQGFTHDFDYMIGGPSLRAEHMHWLDIPDGYERLEVVIATRTKVITGFSWKASGHTANWDKYIQDSLIVGAHGLPVAGSVYPDWINYPPAVLENSTRTFAGDGAGEASTRAIKLVPNDGSVKGSPWAAMATSLWVIGTNGIIAGADGQHGAQFQTLNARTPSAEPGWGPSGDTGMRPVGSGILQRGRKVTDGTGAITASSRLPAAGDQHMVVLTIGRPSHIWSSSSSAGNAGHIPANLSVRGLQRVVLWFNCVAMAYADNVNVGIDMAAAPGLRQVIDGDIFAVLS